MHEFGIIFVATKDGRYVDEAQAALASLKDKAPGVPATLMTTLPEMVNKTDHGFDLVIGIATAHGFGSSLAEARLDRWSVLLRSPYEKTLLLDTDMVIASDTIAEMEAILEDHDLAMATPTDVTVVPSGMTDHVFDTAMIGIRRSAAADAMVEQVCAIYREHLTLANDDEAILDGPLAELSRLAVPARKALLFSDRLALTRVLSDAACPKGLQVKTLDKDWLHTGENPPADARVIHTGPSASARAGEVAFSDQLSILFPQQLFWRQHKNVAELNKQLALFCEQVCTEKSTGHTAMRGGLRSPVNIFEDKAPAMEALRQMINNALRLYMDNTLKQLMPQASTAFDISIEGWAYILGPGDHLSPHLHSNGLISGTYYVEMPDRTSGDDARQARLVIENPIVQAAMAQPPVPLTNQHVIDVKEGALVMFPAYLKHHVPPFRGEGRRISISFECALKSALKA